MSLTSFLPARIFGSSRPVHTPHHSSATALEMLGREHSGKTRLKSMVFNTACAGPLPSGLELTAKHPKEMVKQMNEAIATYQGLQQTGFNTTINPDLFTYHLYEADRPKCELQLRESVGQLLTDDGSDDRMMQMFNKHHENLSKADVMYVIVSCPPDGSPASISRLQYDLTVMMPNIRMVLENRDPQHKLAVAIVLTKLDGTYPDTEAARTTLKDDILRGMCGRFVRTLENSDRVGLAAIFPTSAFGFGKSRLLQPATPPANGKSAPARGFSLLSQGEPEWILKEGVMPEPYNLTELLWWTMMAGLALRPIDDRGQDHARTVELLRDDLKAMDAWFVPLNCRPIR